MADIPIWCKIDLNFNRKLKDNKEPEVYDEYNPEENYDQQKSNEKFDEMGSRERDTQNLSVTQLIDNNAQDESNLVLNK